MVSFRAHIGDDCAKTVQKIPLPPYMFFLTHSVIFIESVTIWIWENVPHNFFFQDFQHKMCQFRGNDHFTGGHTPWQATSWHYYSWVITLANTLKKKPVIPLGLESLPFVPELKFSISLSLFFADGKVTHWQWNLLIALGQCIQHQNK